MYAMLAVVALQLEEEMSPIVKFICKFESPYTKSHKQSSYLGKMYWFYVSLLSHAKPTTERDSCADSWTD